jgi:hypothetical protein
MASTTRDVYRLNYDCELRGNQILREQGAGVNFIFICVHRDLHARLPV